MEIKDYLKKLNIKYKLHKHEAVFSCEESKKLREINGMHAKSLVVKTKKSGNYYMIVIPCDEKIDRKKIKSLLNEDIRFANEEELLTIINLTPGSISPMGLINDKNLKIILIIEKSVWDAEIVNFHPNINTESLEMPQKDFHKYIKSLKNKLIIM